MHTLQISILFNFQLLHEHAHTHHNVKWKRVIELIWTNQSISLHSLNSLYRPLYLVRLISKLFLIALSWIFCFPMKKIEKNEKKRVSFAFQICLMVSFLLILFLFSKFSKKILIDSINPKNNFSCVWSFDKCAWFLFLIYHLNII